MGRDDEGAAPAAAADAPAAAAAAAAPAPAAAKPPRKNRGNLRKRAPADGDGGDGGGGDDDGTSVVRKAKAQRGDPLAFSTKKEAGADGHGVTFASSAAPLAAKDESATRALETETEFDRDARAQRERLLAASTAGPTSDNKYRGMNSYVDYSTGMRREANVGSEKGGGAHGPLRGNVFVRTTARFDYQPDVCKDYKETGFCSYGDSCKFMHDRGDYKSGWELEAEWEAEQKRRQEALTKGWNPDGEDEEEEPAEEEDELPFACYICREPWAECKSDPVVTRCKHYFCEACALKRNAKTGKCAACDQPTQGIFNVAADVVKKLKKAKDAGGGAG
ncbi:zZinc finger CCCH domain-containing protein 1 [Scenedesmus sp. PABB004]|nr:zZinc finger CCCH domain-containing protein 1 [Scenedesmus sp. PABB004]